MLNKNQETSLSKFMTKLLRHSPDGYGLRLDPEDGSCLLEHLLDVLRSEPRWREVTLSDIEQVVRHCDKQRFEIADERIRARYGHSHTRVSYPEQAPPQELYHGTNERALPAILKEGLRPMGRMFVHLSEGLHFASLAGKHRGKLVLLRIDTKRAQEQGIAFYYAGNEVWLAAAVPADCCKLYTEDKES